jgi:hypothetical protein
MAWCSVTAQGQLYLGLTFTPEGKKPLGRSRRRWKYIRMQYLEIGWKGADWIHEEQDRNLSRALVNTVMKLRVP